MRPAELLELIQQSTGVLKLDSVVRGFRRRTRQFPVDLSDILQALGESQTIQEVHCCPVFTFGLAENEWNQIIRALGKMPCLQTLKFLDYGHGGFLTLPAAGLSTVLRNAKQLESLELSDKVVIVDTERMDECEQLADALAESSLGHLVCECLFRGGQAARRIIVTRGIQRCSTLETLTLRDHLRQLTTEQTVAVVEALPSLKHLSLYTSQWSAIGRTLSTNHTLHKLALTDHFVEPQQFCTFLENLTPNDTLRELSICLIEGFSHYTMKEGLNRFIRQNKHLHSLCLKDSLSGRPSPSWATSFQWTDWSYLASSQRLNGRIQINIYGMSQHVPPSASDAARYWRYRTLVEVENALNRTHNLLELVHEISAKDDLFRVECLFCFFVRHPGVFRQASTPRISKSIV